MLVCLWACQTQVCAVQAEAAYLRHVRVCLRVCLTTHRGCDALDWVLVILGLVGGLGNGGKRRQPAALNQSVGSSCQHSCTHEYKYDCHVSGSALTSSLHPTTSPMFFARLCRFLSAVMLPLFSIIFGKWGAVCRHTSRLCCVAAHVVRRPGKHVVAAADTITEARNLTACVYVLLLPLPGVAFAGDFTNVFGTYIPPCFGLPPLPGFLTTQQFNAQISQLSLKFLYLALGTCLFVCVLVGGHGAGNVVDVLVCRSNCIHVCSGSCGWVGGRFVAIRLSRGKNRSLVFSHSYARTLCCVHTPAGAAAAGFLQQFCWQYTSVRQTNRWRRRYLEAVLSQDISFFDTQASVRQ